MNRIGWRLASAVAFVTAGMALAIVYTGAPASPPAPRVAPPVYAAASGKPKVVGLPAENAPPAELTIASIGVRTPLVDLNRNPDGTLTVPSDYQVAGWYANGPTPAKVAAHRRSSPDTSTRKTALPSSTG
ncbi:hypothetical protein Pflav_050610 [Phytohabitans flavus]|uniref:Class F sortase n=1 Tax=Phytohabitans flavus TaxID=1076124 RepID=A0A6F8XY47_9ACTN|nr:class F sortase [Phytohabitans flavus]BCB78651.1 hypothetical protein Pflav_050610 [Phytohabitans flavus]